MDFIEPSLKQYEQTSEVIAQTAAAHDDVERRRDAVSSSFFEKLAAMDAGSIAVAISVDLAISTKPELHGFARAIPALIGLFWLSLVSSVLHNFLLVQQAKLETQISFISTTQRVFCRAVDLVESVNTNVSSETWHTLKQLMADQLMPKASRKAKTSKKLNPWISGFGYVASVFFLAGYTLVMIGAIVFARGR